MSRLCPITSPITPIRVPYCACNSQGHVTRNGSWTAAEPELYTRVQAESARRSRQKPEKADNCSKFGVPTSTLSTFISQRYLNSKSRKMWPEKINYDGKDHISKLVELERLTDFVGSVHVPVMHVHL